MIKWFKKQDIIVTDFVYAHKKDLATLNNNFKEFNVNVNTSSFFQRGEYINNNIFYPTSSIYYKESENPINFTDKSYKGQVYNMVKNMYYNDYNNAYNQFGFSTYDKSYAKLNLANKFIALNFNMLQLGDGIQPKSVNIKNYSGDIIGTIVDDGFNNLYLSGSYFIDKQEYTSSTDNLIKSIGEYGLSDVIDQNSYTYIKYNFTNVPILIELECVAICEGDNITIDDLLQSVHLHFLGSLDGDWFEYDNHKGDILEFYDGYNKITTTRSYRKGDIIIVKFTDAFKENPSNYIEVESGDICTNTYTYIPNDDGGVLPVDECRYVYITPIVEGVRICDSSSGGTEENLKNWIANIMQFEIRGLIGDDTGNIILKDTIQYSDWTTGNASSPKQIEILPNDPLSNVKFIPSKKNKFNYIPVFNNATLLLTNCDSSIPIVCSVDKYSQAEQCYPIDYRASQSEYEDLLNNTVSITISGLIDGDSGTAEVTSNWNTDLAAGSQIDLICQNFTPDSNNIHTYTSTYVNGCIKVKQQETRNLDICVNDIDVCQYARSTPIIEQNNFTFTGLEGTDSGTANASIVNFNSSYPLGRTFKIVINGFTPNSNNRYIYNLGTLCTAKATLIDCGLMPPHINVIVTANINTSSFCPNDEDFNPIISDTKIYKDDYNQELSTELIQNIVATETVPGYIEHTGDYDFERTYNVIPPTYNFTSNTSDYVNFTITYVNTTVSTKTRTECNVVEQYTITFYATKVYACEGHIVTSDECGYGYSPTLQSNLDIIKNVEYSIDNVNNRILVTHAEIEKHGEGLYEYIIQYSNTPATISRTAKTRIPITITPITTINQGVPICNSDTEEQVISKLTTTYTYNGLESGDSISNVTYEYTVGTNAIQTRITGATITLGDDDVCYYYDPIYDHETINIQRQECTTPEPPTPEPTVIPITFIPNDVTICQGETASPNGYTKSRDLEPGDSVKPGTDTLIVVNNEIIKFVQTPEIISSDETDHVYNVSKVDGNVIEKDCFEINPQCPDLCIVEGETSADVESMVLNNINSAINYSQLKTNESIKTKDIVKSITYNVNVTNNNS